MGHLLDLILLAIEIVALGTVFSAFVLKVIDKNKLTDLLTPLVICLIMTAGNLILISMHTEIRSMLIVGTAFPLICLVWTILMMLNRDKKAVSNF